MRGDPSDPHVWLAYAIRDYQWAKRDLEQDEPLRAVISLQQTAEKILKAKLVSLGWSLQKSHSLSHLLSELHKHNIDHDWFQSCAEALSYEYFAERYPGDFDEPPSLMEVREFEVQVLKLIHLLFPDSLH